MKGEHVIGLIDTDALAGHSAAHPDAWRHAQGCATCGAALAAATRVRNGLKSLPQPGPSRDLSASVLARIAQLDDALSSRTDPAIARAAARRHRTSIWLTAIGAAVAALAIGVFVASSGAAAFGAAVGGSAIRSGLMAPSGVGAVALAGLVVYVAGLFAAVDRVGRSAR